MSDKHHNRNLIFKSCLLPGLQAVKLAYYGPHLNSFCSINMYGMYLSLYSSIPLVSTMLRQKNKEPKTCVYACKQLSTLHKSTVQFVLPRLLASLEPPGHEPVTHLVLGVRIQARPRLLAVREMNTPVYTGDKEKERQRIEQRDGGEQPWGTITNFTIADWPHPQTEQITGLGWWTASTLISL